MSKIAIFVVLAVAACIIPNAMSACPSWQLNNLESQIEICSKGLPLQMRQGYWQWARAVSRRMSKESTCQLENAVAYYQSVLQNQGYIGNSDISRGVNCLKNSITYGICC